MKNKILVITVIFLSGYFLGWIVPANSPINDKEEFRPIRQGNSSYEFINPLLAYEVPSATDPRLRKVKDVASAAIDRSLQDEQIETISVYFRNLAEGQWFGINENEKYAPASLLKVPLMLSYLKDAEIDPTILDKSLVYDLPEDKNILEVIKPAEVMEKGKSYTIADLIRRMIIYSDNNALQILSNNLSLTKFQEAYTDLGIDYPPNSGTSDLFSPKSYAFFYRVLYNATYVSQDLSENALKLLAQTTYDKGIRTGVPAEIKVAHKFGERIVQTFNGSYSQVQFHDCGIVYYRQNNYLLCIMTKGKNLEKQENALGEIAKAIYDQFSKEY